MTKRWQCISEITCEKCLKHAYWKLIIDTIGTFSPLFVLKWYEGWKEYRLCLLAVKCLGNNLNQVNFSSVEILNIAVGTVSS